MKRTVRLAAALLGASLAACVTTGPGGETVADSALSTQVKVALAGDPRAQIRDLAVSSSRGVVQLQGTAGSDEARTEAERVTARVTGVREVNNALKIMPSTVVGTALDDSAITTRVKAALLGNPLTRTDPIDVTTSRGIVMLSGFVASNEQLSTARNVAGSIQGVKGVDNALQLKAATSAQ